jgi:hydroxymethylpyrimidine pyrophosphatase-like HAD family hydrolase
VRLLEEHRAELAALPPPRVVYTDLDGTLLGPGGSLFATGEGGVTEAAAGALAGLHRAGIEVVPVSGRTSDQVWETARLLGASDYVAELGGLVVLDRREQVLRRFGEHAGPGTPYGTMTETGAAALLLEAFPRRLEPHAPWAFLPRECSILLRGHVALEEAERTLTDSGHRWLELRDNGVIPRTFPGLDVEEVHAYHLIPRGVSKGSGVAAHRDHRGLRPEECVAVGDAPADAELAPEVGTVFIVANGLEPVRRSGTVAENVYGTRAFHGDGFAEAVSVLLGSDQP